jgi:hypothetical protein
MGGSTMMRAPSGLDRPRMAVTRKIVIALAFAAAIAAVVLLTERHAHGQLASAPWPMFQHDLWHTGLSQYGVNRRG